MKRIITLMLAATFVLGTVAASYAIHTQGKGGSGLDFNARGSWRVVGEWADNYDYDESDEEETLFVDMRARVWFDFTTADNVKAVLGLEIGDAQFGTADGLDLGGDVLPALELKHLYVAFPWPNTDVTISAGLQGVALPGVYSNPIFDNDVASVLVSTPITDMVGLTLGWLRPFDESASKSASGAGDEFDIFAAILPVTLEGISLVPYAVYANIGSEAFDDALGIFGSNVVVPGDDDTTAWWAGLNFAVNMFDPIGIRGDLIYGSAEHDTSVGSIDQDGWFALLAVNYAMDMFTPEVFAFYASGEDADEATDDMSRMLWVSPDFVPTTFFWDASSLGIAQQTNPASIGLWGIGAMLKDITFVENLSHTLRVAYYQGTSEDDAAYLLSQELNFDEEDSMIEVNFDTTYQMYEQLKALVEIGYLQPDFDDDGREDDAAYKLGIGFKYDF